MSQKCCSKEGFVAVSKLYNFHNKKLRNLLVVNFSEQQFKHAESTTRFRVCKKFVRQFFPSEHKILQWFELRFYLVIFLGRFCFVVYPQLLVRTWLTGKPEKVVINSFFRAQFVPLCQSCSRLHLEQLLHFFRGFQTSHANHELIIYLSDRPSFCFACYWNYLPID